MCYQKIFGNRIAANENYHIDFHRRRHNAKVRPNNGGPHKYFRSSICAVISLPMSLESYYDPEYGK